jgi:sigma-B regulation protein RsbU (phosphoserine phosphatase)
MSQHSILIVEDEHTLRRLLEYRLRKKYAVRTAENGEVALTKVQDEIPDLIVSDIMMPQMDGFALQEALQDDRHTRTIPFIFLTAKTDEDSQAKGLNTGVDDYITKPFDMERLISRIDRLLERTELYRSNLNARIGQDFSQRLIPKDIPSVEGYELSFYCNPREDGGGDLFDWTRFPDGSYLFTIGDVMGKGIQAKFYAYSFLSYVRATLRTVKEESSSPALILQRVNEMLINDEMLGDTFASLLLIRWDPETHEITYSNAGHCHPMLFSREEAEIVEYSNLILGLEEEADFTDTTLDLEPDHALIVYTDALIEQEKPDGTLTGEETVLETAKEAYGSDDSIQALLNGLLDRSTAEEFDDDILVFWLQRND